METKDGSIGFGLTGHFLARAVITALHEHILPVVRGMDIRDVEKIHQRIWQKLNLRAMSDRISMALSCLDSAL
ncbi:hypothetical protein [Hoeflea ulvae]|uniref:Uncharacterized protein n=1 Tax=Hoeflea ulvae TaxID=2983764 RepID=A0ABT3YD74_9HYPH|nr:hypothetical protein [Hoeflea ulvae]MCY0093838.1 hypothetical protein [Hoeflea ulvae]